MRSPTLQRGSVLREFLRFPFPISWLTCKALRADETTSPGNQLPE